MVAIARYLNVTLIIPELDNTSFWNDHRYIHTHIHLLLCTRVKPHFTSIWHLNCSQFADIFDVDYFIASLRDEVRILKELPPAQKKKVEMESLFSMPPVSWSNMTYYYNTVGSLTEVVPSYTIRLCRRVSHVIRTVLNLWVVTVR